METCNAGGASDLVLPFIYEVAGSINGEQAEVVLDGSISPGEVRFEMTLVRPKVPLLWDEAIVSFVAMDPLLRLAMALDFHLDSEELEDAVDDDFRIESSVYREPDLPVGRFVLVGTCGHAEGRVAARAQFVEGGLDFEPMERVTSLDEAQCLSVLEAGCGRVVTTRAWSVETSRGNSYSGVSVMRSQRLDGEQVGQCRGGLGVWCSRAEGAQPMWALEVGLGGAWK